MACEPQRPPQLQNQQTFETSRGTARVYGLAILDRFVKASEKVEELNKHVTMIRINELFKGGDFSKTKFTLSVNRQGISHGKAIGMYRELAGPTPERVPTERT